MKYHVLQSDYKGRLVELTVTADSYRFVGDETGYHSRDLVFVIEGITPNEVARFTSYTAIYTDAATVTGRKL